MCFLYVLRWILLQNSPNDVIICINGKSSIAGLMGVNLLIEYSRQSGIQSDDCPADKCYTAPTNHSLKFETVEDQLQSALDLVSPCVLYSSVNAKENVKQCREIKALQSIVNATLKSAARYARVCTHAVFICCVHAIALTNAAYSNGICTSGQHSWWR